MLKANNRKPTALEQLRIKAILKMGKHEPFAKCAKRSFLRAQELDIAAGISPEDITNGKGFHTAHGHVCSLCRCNAIAGAGTWGWYYWPDKSGKTSWRDGDAYGLREEELGNVGHYGVGPCFWHGQSLRSQGKTIFGRAGLAGMVRREIEIMRTRGAAPDASGDFLVELDGDVEIAHVRNDIRTAADHIRGRLMQWQQKIIENSTLTENGSSGPVDMSDKTKITLDIALARALADIAKNEFLVDHQSYIHRDEMVLLLSRFMSCAQKYINDSADWGEFVANIKDAASNVKSGRVIRSKQVINVEAHSIEPSET